MAHFSRIALLLPALALATGCPESREKADDDPPVFAGLQGAVAIAPGTVQLGWEAASDRSHVTYRVWTASAPGAEPFSQTPIVETDELSITITGIVVGAVPAYFVVRARDARGNEESNTVERAVSFGDNRLSLIGAYEEPAASDIALSTSSDIVAMAGFWTDPEVRSWIYDVSNPADPQKIATINGDGRSTDVEIQGNVLWVATEGDPAGRGAHSYDITNPAAPVPLGYVDGIGLGDCHTIWLDGNILYCASTDGSDDGSPTDGFIYLVDVTNPAAPIPRGAVGIPERQVHDMYVKDGFAVGAFLSGGFAFLDVSDPMNPTLGTVVDYPGAFTHNAWPTADGTHLLTTDENANGRLRIWDITNRSSVVQVGEYIVDPGPGPHAIVHNVQVLGDLAYVAWYEAGVIILDISTPSSPLLVGWHDTWEDATEGFFAGAWTATPKPGTPYVFVSDLTSGLYVMELED